MTTLNNFYFPFLFHEQKEMVNCRSIAAFSFISINAFLISIKWSPFSDLRSNSYSSEMNKNIFDLWELFIVFLFAIFPEHEKLFPVFFFGFEYHERHLSVWFPPEFLLLFPSLLSVDKHQLIFQCDFSNNYNRKENQLSEYGFRFYFPFS